jgi:hypothetical protein
MFYQTRRSELELIYLSNYCNCSRFKRPGHCIALHCIAWHGMAWHRDPRRVMILPINGPWAHLASSRCAGPRQKEAHDSVSQTNAHSCVESTRISLDRCSLKRDEVQWELLCSANPRTTSRMERHQALKPLDS